jgi:hypothetical protein
VTSVKRKVQRLSVSTVFSNGKRRPVVIELNPPGDVITFRLHGERRAYGLSVDWMYKTAAARQAALDRAERRAARKKQ